jgi:tetratricopeptide (TPR) repeat protein
VLSFRRFRPLFAWILVAATGASLAQDPAQGKPAGPSQMHGRLLLVLPFENRTGVTGLNWIGDAFPDILNRRLNSSGYLAIGRGDRLYAFDHLGLPLNLQPSRAMTIRIAQLVDADYVIFGSYTVDQNQQLTATAEILDVPALRLGPDVVQSGSQAQLVSLINRLAWKVATHLDPHFAVDEQTFLVADGDLHTDAFEQYLQGLVAAAPEDQLTHLLAAVKLDPQFAPAWLQLGLAYFRNQDFPEAAATLGRLPTHDPNALEADFYRGMAFFHMGDYREAEDAFAFDSRRLALPEVVNNEGVAASRRGKDATALFRQAVDADPQDPDYHFNLAIALARHGDTAGALEEVEDTLKLRPSDTDGQAFEAQLKNPPPPNPDPGHAITDWQGPLERIKPSYSDTEVRQAAFELEQIQAMRLASMPAAQRAAALVKDGDAFFQRGLVLEAEREYREALAADSASAPGHAGLAAVWERDGNPGAARQEANASIRIHPNAPAYLVLAKLDLQANQVAAAQQDVSEALHLDPQNTGVKAVQQAVAKRESGSQ